VSGNAEQPNGFEERYTSGALRLKTGLMASKPNNEKWCRDILFNLFL
jgi:hypothetical protein